MNHLDACSYPIFSKGVWSFVAFFLYDLPFGVGKPFAGSNRVLDKIVGGWQVGSIVTFSDGTPVNVGGIGDRANMGNANWPDATGISPIPDQRTTQCFWNIAAFDTTNSALAYRNGTAGRNILFRPGLRQWDFSLSKNTTIREGHALQFRFEAFNFGNHPNWNQPASDARNANTFGVINTARTMREMQLALKYIF